MKETSVIKGGVSVGFRSYIKIEKSKRSLNPIQDEVKMEEGGGQKGRFYQFSPVTSTNLGIIS